VDKRTASLHKDSAKFVWARSLLAELDGSEYGLSIQKQILTGMCKFRTLPDKDVPNPNAGLDALRRLKEMTVENQLLIEDKKKESVHKKQIQEEKVKIVQNRAKKLEELKNIFVSSIYSKNRQGAGYALEDILTKLFPIFEIEYKKSYKTETQQIDGHFKFEGFDYLVEARWREGLPIESDIGSFKRKIDTKLESTRGIFVSINGFKEDVLKTFEGQGSNILFFCGQDITYILEGTIALDEVIRNKIDKAAQTGKVYYPVRLMM